MRIVSALLMLTLCTVAFAQAVPQAAPQPAPEAAQAAAPVASPGPNLRLILPPEIPAVPGVEVNLYFDDVILYPSTDFFTFDVDCPKGRQQRERYTWVPAAGDVGKYPLTLRIYGPNDKLLAQGQTVIHVYPQDAGAGQDVSLLIVGDSLTNATVYPEAIYDLCQKPDNPHLKLIGTNAPLKDRPEIRHEGYGGWRASSFVSMWAPTIDPNNPRRQRSPFLFEENGKPTLDFQRYCDENNGGKAPDVITILLGCNDNFGATDDNLEESIDSFFKNMDILIAEFHKVNPATKIGIVTLMPPAASQDAFGANYGCGQTRWQYLKNQHRVVEREFAKWSGKEADNIFLIPAYLGLDCVHNFPIVKVPVNAHSDIVVGRLNNGVHPAPSGYKQLADSIYSWLKGMYSK